MSQAPWPYYGQWLREQRQARGSTAPDLIRRLRAAATSVGDRLPSNKTLLVMVYRWEDDRSGISERYRLHYCRVLGIPVAEFGKSPPPRTRPAERLADESALMLAEAGLMLLSASVEYLRNGGLSGAARMGVYSRKASELAGRMRAAQRELNGSTELLTWKVWADQELLLEGDEGKARQFAVKRIADEADLTLESPDGVFYCYQDGQWTPSDGVGWEGDFRR